MRATLHILATFGLLLAVVVGCGKFTGGDDATGAGGAQCSVAIIDLDAVARELGYDQQMASAVEQQKASLEKQLGVIKTSFEEDLAKPKEQLGANPSLEVGRLHPVIVQEGPVPVLIEHTVDLEGWVGIDGIGDFLIGDLEAEPTGLLAYKPFFYQALQRFLL